MNGFTASVNSHQAAPIFLRKARAASLQLRWLRAALQPLKFLPRLPARSSAKPLTSTSADGAPPLARSASCCLAALLALAIQARRRRWNSRQRRADVHPVGRNCGVRRRRPEAEALDPPIPGRPWCKPDHHRDGHQRHHHAHLHLHAQRQLTTRSAASVRFMWSACLRFSAAILNRSGRC